MSADVIVPGIVATGAVGVLGFFVRHWIAQLEESVRSALIRGEQHGERITRLEVGMERVTRLEAEVSNLKPRRRNG